MIVITTPTGQIGSQLLTELHAVCDEPLRVIVRDPSRLADAVRDRTQVIVGSHDDPRVLDQALDGAQGLFWLIPPDMTARSARERYLGFARPAVEAIARHGVGHVVAVSSAGRDYPRDAGLLSAAFAMDAELERSGAAYRSLGMPFYMENLLGQLPRMTSQGVFSLPVSPHEPMALIATRDIAATAAGLLAHREWHGTEHIPVFGPDHLTPTEMADVLTQTLGSPVAFQEADVEQLTAMMVDRGTSEGMAHDFAAMCRAQRDGIYEHDWARATPTATTFRSWCHTELAPAAR